MTPEEQLLDYRRIVAAMYARLRATQTGDPSSYQQFRRDRDELFRSHPQSALSADQKAGFNGLQYYAYDPVLRFEVPIEPVAAPTIDETALQDDGTFRMRRFGQIALCMSGQDMYLSVYWIIGYGGGIFLPFRDLTNEHETYGGGRYLLDTIKGADLGHVGTRLVVDFNYAYNPSCAYNERWVCPLSPVQNRLPVAIYAGELRYSDT